ncbi:hypothetical protein DH2020_044086 [Rehmannia glutinosa]|uniref:DUF641 domain-containing protein n=1 Tax=Rehmannia glutinosa TaxID=99300 RepID=A0ABR0UHV8_REHGL
MEFAASSKPLKPPTNISDMVSKLANVRKFRSIGVFNTPENPNHGHAYQITSSDNAPFVKEESDIATEDVVLYATKIHPKLSGVQKNGNVCDHVEILKLFDSLLALKLAYVKLQEAHIPYDPKKIRAADEEVVTLLDSLCTIKKAYKEKLLKEANSVSACSALLLAQIQVQERALVKLKSQAKNKDNEVARLRRELHELEMRNKKLAEEIREREWESFTGLNHNSFENVVKEVGKAIHDFTKPLIALMKLSDWDLDQAANAVQASVVYTKRSHKKYAFEAYVARRMFHGFSRQPCFMDNIMSLEDPIVALGLTAFVEPKAEMFGVKQGSEFSDIYMEVVEELNGYEAQLEKGQERYKVEFMVMPGFKLGETLIRSQVYVSKRVFYNGTD